MSLRQLRQDDVPGNANEGLVDVVEAARMLSVSVSTLYGWIWQRRIAFVKMGRAVRFEHRVLREFIQQSRVEPRRLLKS
ncbi:MAG: helix-turn-helix domain-containing protein [Candidatus Acidiferrum sp.]|jgi:excisionase family DNA binding protein